MASLTQRQINIIAIVIALLLAPVLSYGSAMLLDKQSSQASKVRLVKAPIAPQTDLDPEVRARIAEAIRLADQ